MKMQQESSVMKLEEEIYIGQLRNLYFAVESLSSKKLNEDLFNFEKQVFEDKQVSYMSEIQTLDKETSRLLNERDRCRSDLKEMIKGRHLMIKEKQNYAKQMNVKVTGLEKDLEDIIAKLTLVEEEYA